MEDLCDEDFYSVVCALVSVIFETYDPVVQHDSVLTGRAYFEELMATASWARFHDVCRMEKQAFKSVLDILICEGGLTDSQSVCTGEKLMILIQILCGFLNRQLNERWQHSGSTISRSITDAINSLLQCKRFFFFSARMFIQYDSTK